MKRKLKRCDNDVLSVHPRARCHLLYRMSRIVQMSNSSKTKINSHTKNWSVPNIFIWFQEEEKRNILEIRSSVYTTDIRLSKLLRPRNLFVRFARKSWNNKTFSYQYFFYRFNETRKTLIKGWSPRQVRSYFI